VVNERKFVSCLFCHNIQSKKAFATTIKKIILLLRRALCVENYTLCSSKENKIKPFFGWGEPRVGGVDLFTFSLLSEPTPRDKETGKRAKRERERKKVLVTIFFSFSPFSIFLYLSIYPREKKKI